MPLPAPTTLARHWPNSLILTWCPPTCALDRLYQRAAFASEKDRVAHVLGMYEQQVAGMLAMQKKKKPRRTAKSKADKV